MRIFIFLAIIFLTPQVFAGEEDLQECTLKNTEFCGIWGDSDNFKFMIMGDHLTIDKDSYKCMVVKEGEFADQRPFSLMRCSNSENSDVTGFLTTYYPIKTWREDQKFHSAQLYIYSRFSSTDPCFSEKVTAHETCDAASLMDAHRVYSRFPIYK